MAMSYPGTLSPTRVRCEVSIGEASYETTDLTFDLAPLFRKLGTYDGIGHRFVR